jgi:tRNA G37 N-methylase TrmD
LIQYVIETETFFFDVLIGEAIVIGGWYCVEAVDLREWHEQKSIDDVVFGGETYTCHTKEFTLWHNFWHDSHQGCP